MRAIILLFIVSIIISCQNAQKEVYTAKTLLDKDSSLISNEHPGKKLLEQNCYVCHNSTTNEELRIAPPMIAIKKHYITSSTTKSEFKKTLQKWIKNPNEKDAKMFGAVRRFGVMPKTPFSEENIDQIADYLFDHEIEQPTWFEDHYKKERRGMGNGKRMGLQKRMTYKERGLKYVQATKTELGKKLKGTIQKKGTVEALEFCNKKAYPLADSLSLVYNATIKRVSDKPRNTHNRASLDELKYIKAFKTTLVNKKEPQPIIVKTRDSVRFYYPITTNALCLQCHGQPQQEIQSKTLQSIQTFYPNDQAIGYGINEVRGIWSITFHK
jgi:cytochrome c553/nitrate reductase cytochrome c-type subunit